MISEKEVEIGTNPQRFSGLPLLYMQICKYYISMTVNFT